MGKTVGVRVLGGILAGVNPYGARVEARGGGLDTNFNTFDHGLGSLGGLPGPKAAKGAIKEAHGGASEAQGRPKGGPEEARHRL